jgi:AraC-like DNA-binding protein
MEAVAYAAGFENLSYFNRVFLKKTGKQPGRFRKQFLADKKEQ